MSKKTLSTILMVASVAAMFIPVGGVVVGLGLKIATHVLLSVGLAVGASLLRPKAAAAPANAQSRLQATFEVNAPRKIVFGTTAMATDVRYQAYTGTNQEYLDQILCVASHLCESIDELWFDAKMAWSAASGVTSDFTGYLTIDVRNPGTSSNGIAIDSVWTSSCTLTGCAYLHLRYKLTGSSSKATSPFSSSIPSRVTVRGKGARVPDLRVAGVDPSDQSTWVFSSAGSESGRNPAWARLFYLIGWRINGKLAVGCGIPPSRLDLATYTTAANHCDETISLPGGGTERRYRHDMVYSESETPATVLGNINTAMNAQPTDDAGKIGVICLHDDLSDPDILTLSDDDLAEPASEKWDPDAQLHQTVNLVRGQSTDPSDAALYQLRPETEVALNDAAHDFGSPDGIQRIGQLPAPQVQSATQWQRLARLQLLRSTIPGVYTASFKAKGWQARMWKPVKFSHRGLGFSNKLFRVLGIELPTGSVVKLTLREESSSIYADGGETLPPAAVAPGAWNPANDPLVAGIGVAGTTADWPSVTDSASTKPANNATVGAAWGTNLSGKPANVAALTGSEGIQNTLVSLTNGGAISGAGGGALTLGGVQTAFGTTIDNTAITVNGSGVLTGIGTASKVVDNSIINVTSGLIGGIGTGTGTAVGNSLIQISGNTLVGIGTGSGTAVVNAGVSLTSGGALSGAGGGSLTISGVETAFGKVLRNDAITVASGVLSGIGTASVEVDNSRLSLTSDSAGTGGRARVLLNTNAGATTLTTLQLPAASQNLDITISGNNLNGIGTGAGTAVANAGVSLSAGGALAGAGGGSLTVSGVETAFGEVLRNSVINVTSGLLGGIGTGNGSAVGNSLITISGTAISGIGTGSGTNVANSGLSISANGTFNGGGGGQVTAPGLGVAVGATADVKLTPILGSAYVVVTGNSITTGPSATGFNTGVYADPIYGSSFAEANIISGSNYTCVALDNENTTYDYLTLEAYGQYNSGTGGVALYYNGTLQFNTGIATGITGKLQLVCDRVNVYLIVGGTAYGPYAAPAALTGSAAIYPKFHVYSAGSTQTGNRAGAWTSNKAADLLYAGGATVDSLKPFEVSASVTSSIGGDPVITLEADYQGTLLTGEITRDVPYKLYRNGIVQTSGVTWARTVISGTSTSSISGTGTGTLSITAFTSETKIRLDATYGGNVVASFNVTVTKHLGAAPTSGGAGATSASTSTITGTASSSYGSANSGPLTIRCPASGTINYSLAPANYKRTTTTAGNSGAHGKVQWRIVGGTFADVTTETASSSDASTINEPPVQQSPGQLAISGTKTGLTSGSDYEFQLLLRSDGATQINFTGTFEVHQ